MKEEFETLQNDDGGWPYRNGGTSWTEPTVFALIALVAKGELDSPAIEKGGRWLQAVQAEDGGWRPQASVYQSTWVGALVGMLPESIIPTAARVANLKWLVAQMGQESSRLYRVRQWMIGNPPNSSGQGWAWFPGATAWVTPTALTILALRKQKDFNDNGGTIRSRISLRIEEGQNFLAMHACRSGGWNHGAAQALGYQADAYPETTGLALLALSGTESSAKEAGLLAARRFLPACRSAEAYAWLSLGLKANGEDPEAIHRAYEPRTVVDAALLSLVDSAQAGIDIWMPKT